jgi:CDP-6-deoxy-D-xylo-4-hexulose-3-dehydrase
MNESGWEDYVQSQCPAGGHLEVSAENVPPAIGDIVLCRFEGDGSEPVVSPPGLVVSGPDSDGDIEILRISREAEGNADDRIEIVPGELAAGEFPSPCWVELSIAESVQAADVALRVGTVARATIEKILKRRILTATRTYSRLAHRAQAPVADTVVSDWKPGQALPYAARVFDADEVEAAVSSTLDFWLTLGPEGGKFESELAGYLGVKHCLLVNSGSSANLVAMSVLTSHRLPAHRRIRSGDEVITVAAGFPTTVAPILQLGAVPVFLDNDPTTGNLRAEDLEAAYAAGKTKAVMVAHALGNPFNLSAVLAFCRRHDLWLVEDNCDALGCTYSLPVESARALGLDHLLRLAGKKGGNRKSENENLENVSACDFPKNEEPRTRNQEQRTKNKELSIPFIRNGILTAYTGSFGDLSTQSFYPPHHLTMGEGGAVSIVRHAPLKKIAESIRDWGRDCWCASGCDDTCGKRFDWQLGELPRGYDHKYIYSHLGYNLKPLDLQAAIGRRQLLKLPAFVESRKRNWEILRRGLDDLGHVFEFTLPTHALRWIPPRERGPRDECRGTDDGARSEFEWDGTGAQTDCSWFGFMLRVRADAPFSHTDLARHLERHKIGSRMLFGGNLLRQPVFVQLRRDRHGALRLVGRTAEVGEDCSDVIGRKFPGADEIMNRALFLGTYPGLTRAMLEHEIAVVREFVSERCQKENS